MGYHERIIRQTLRSIDYQEKSTSEIIREALQLLGK
jgi:Holliday junction resolvasome RuvABC DNA-binding subunit